MFVWFINNKEWLSGNSHYQHPRRATLRDLGLLFFKSTSFVTPSQTKFCLGRPPHVPSLLDFPLSLLASKLWAHVFVYRQGHFPPTLKLTLSKLFGFELLSFCVRVAESRKKAPAAVDCGKANDYVSKKEACSLSLVARTNSKSDRCS